MIENMREQRDVDRLQQQKDQLEKQIPKSMEDSIKNNHGAQSVDNVDAPRPEKPQVHRADLDFLSIPVEHRDKGTRPLSAAGYEPSPLRKSNFDLLVLLATQEAIHRVLNDPKRQARKSAEHGSNQFLQDFYVSRLLSHFSGDQTFGRADDFLEEMLECTPRMITVGKNSSNNTTTTTSSNEHTDELTKDLTYLVDPVTVARTVLIEREKVALEWKEQLAGRFEEDHMTIQKMALAKHMSASLNEAEVHFVDPNGNELDSGSSESCFE